MSAASTPLPTTMMREAGRPTSPRAIEPLPWVALAGSALSSARRASSSSRTSTSRSSLRSPNIFEFGEEISIFSAVSSADLLLMIPRWSRSSSFVWSTAPSSPGGMLMAVLVPRRGPTPSM